MSYGSGAINALKFSPSGSAILTAKSDFTVCLWIVKNANQRMARCFESHTKEVNDVDWLDDNVFASAGNDHTIFVYHRSNDKRPTYTFKGHTDDVTRIKWSPAHPGAAPTQRLLASASDDGNVMIWRLPAYPEDRGTHSRSMSPIKIAKDVGEDDYFQNGGAVFGSDHCVNRLAVVTGSENRRMDTVEWSPQCREGRMILAACVKLFRSPSPFTWHDGASLTGFAVAVRIVPSSFSTLCPERHSIRSPV